MFDNMINEIKEETVRLLFHVKIERAPERARVAQETAAVHADAPGAGSGQQNSNGGPIRLQTMVRSKARPGQKGPVQTIKSGQGGPAAMSAGPAGESNGENPYEGLTHPSQIPVKNEEKHGRNDLCPCGSGKKYKNCCGREV